MNVRVEIGKVFLEQDGREQKATGKTPCRGLGVSGLFPGSLGKFTGNSGNFGYFFRRQGPIPAL